jgi:hypothetical protein
VEQLQPESDAIDDDDLAGIRPRVRVANQLCPDRAVTDIFPLLPVTFIRAQNVIKKTALPDRIRIVLASDAFREHLLQQTHPAPEIKYAIP